MDVGQPFNAELHLRLAGERLLLGGTTGGARVPLQFELAEIAAALVAVQALEEAPATQIIADYGLALTLRNRGGMPFMAQPVGGPPAPFAPPSPARVAVCDAELELGGSKVHVLFASLRPDSATLSVTFLPAWGPGGRPGPRMGNPLNGVQVSDDKGSTCAAMFSGGGSPARYQGELTTTRPLAVDTKWLELDGQRIALLDAATPPPVTVETLPIGSDAEAHLWTRLASGRHGPHGGPFPPQIEVAVETLITAGALDPDDPLVDEVRAVLAAFSGQPLQRSVREPWQSLLNAQWRSSTRSGVTTIGVVTPSIGDGPIGLDALVLADGNMELHIRLSQNPGGPWGMHGLPVGPQLVWWAEDDLGNHYLGAPSRWSGGPQGMVGTVAFWPSIEERAQTIRLAPTAARERAMVELTLPRCGGK